MCSILNSMILCGVADSGEAAIVADALKFALVHVVKFAQAVPVPLDTASVLLDQFRLLQTSGQPA